MTTSVKTKQAKRIIAMTFREARSMTSGKRYDLWEITTFSKECFLFCLDERTRIVIEKRIKDNRKKYKPTI